MARELLVIRVDAGGDIGTGHLMRTLAIAEAWIEAGGRVMFLMADGASILEGRATREMVVERVNASAGTTDDVDRTTGVAVASSAAAMLLDGYAFGVDFQEAAVAAGVCCAVIDDHARLDRYAADVVIDANVTSDEQMYRGRIARGRSLLGLQFALLRAEFRAAERVPKRGDAARVLLTFGGSDVARLTERALDAIDPGLEVIALVGPANQHRAQIAMTAERLPNVRVLYDAARVSEHMAWADVALAAAGTTCAELAFMGTPALLVIVAENQRLVAAGFQRLGAARVLGEATSLTGGEMARNVLGLISDDDAREQMTTCGRAAVDGQGAMRVVRVLRETCCAV